MSEAGRVAPRLAAVGCRHQPLAAPAPLKLGPAAASLADRRRLVQRPPSQLKTRPLSSIGGEGAAGAGPAERRSNNKKENEKKEPRLKFTAGSVERESRAGSWRSAAQQKVRSRSAVAPTPRRRFLDIGSRAPELCPIGHFFWRCSNAPRACVCVCVCVYVSCLCRRVWVCEGIGEGV